MTALVLQVHGTGLTVPDSYARQTPPSYADEDMPDAEKEAIFDEMDVNGDGVIDREEWARYHHTTTPRPTRAGSGSRPGRSLSAQADALAERSSAMVAQMHKRYAVKGARVTAVSDSPVLPWTPDEPEF